MTRLGWLKAAVAVMSVLIVAGVATIVVTIIRRAGGTTVAAGPAALHEPAGTRIAAVTASGDRIVLSLTGGGPDRLAVLDARDGRVLLRVALTP